MSVEDTAGHAAHHAHKAGSMLSRQVGPFPLGVWIAVVVGGLGIGWYARRNSASTDTTTVSDNPLDSLPAAGGGGDTSGTVDGSGGGDGGDTGGWLPPLDPGSGDGGDTGAGSGDGGTTPPAGTGTGGTTSHDGWGNPHHHVLVGGVWGYHDANGKFIAYASKPVGSGWTLVPISGPHETFFDRYGRVWYKSTAPTGGTGSSSGGGSTGGGVSHAGWGDTHYHVEVGGVWGYHTSTGRFVPYASKPAGSGWSLRPISGPHETFFDRSGRTWYKSTAASSARVASPRVHK